MYIMQLQTKGQILCTCSYGRLYWWGKLGLRFYFFLVSLFFKLKLIKEETVFNLVKRPSESEGNLSSTIAHAVWPEFWKLVPKNWSSIRFNMASNGSLAVCVIFCLKEKGRMKQNCKTLPGLLVMLYISYVFMLILYVINLGM